VKIIEGVSENNDQAHNVKDKDVRENGSRGNEPYH
jgi:hypothetical protein